MVWSVVILVAVGVVVVVALVATRRADEPPAEADPLFLVGIPVCGASAALPATVGPAALATTFVGMVCTAVGVHRMRTRGP
mgnify:CR=1 FL=1